MEAIIWTVLVLLVGYLARKRGRSIFFWGLLSCFITPILASILLLLLKNKKIYESTKVEVNKLVEKNGNDNNCNILYICPKCKKEIPNESKFCSECGFKIDYDKKVVDISPELNTDITDTVTKQKTDEVYKNIENCDEKLINISSKLNTDIITSQNEIKIDDSCENVEDKLKNKTIEDNIMTVKTISARNGESVKTTTGKLNVRTTVRFN